MARRRGRQATTHTNFGRPILCQPAYCLWHPIKTTCADWRFFGSRFVLKFRININCLPFPRFLQFFSNFFRFLNKKCLLRMCNKSSNDLQSLSSQNRNYVLSRSNSDFEFFRFWNSSRIRTYHTTAQFGFLRLRCLFQLSFCVVIISQPKMYVFLEQRVDRPYSPCCLFFSVFQFLTKIRLKV